MECSSEFRRLANRNRFLEDLELLNYGVDFVGGHIIVYGIPYIGPDGSLKYGDIASPAEIREEFRLDAPSTHQVWFRGEVPYGLNHQPLKISAQANPREITSEFVCPLSFSFKTDGRDRYDTEEEKLKTYIYYISAPALERFGAKPNGRIEIKAMGHQTPLKHPDSLSARDGVNELARQLEGVRVAIVGLGGTGSYVLDFIAKTRLSLIRIIDDDIIHTHTLFRLPGALGDAALGKPKSEVLGAIYSDFHGQIDVQTTKLSEATFDLLNDIDFVFVCIDDAPSRGIICRSCIDRKIAFIDVGMGLYKSDKGLNGFIRCTVGNLEKSADLIGTQYLPTANPKDNEYRRQPQLGELNALNAALAVVRFKQMLNFYEEDDPALANIFEISTFEMDPIL